MCKPKEPPPIDLHALIDGAGGGRGFDDREDDDDSVEEEDEGDVVDDLDPMSEVPDDYPDPGDEPGIENVVMSGEQFRMFGRMMATSPVPLAGIYVEIYATFPVYTALQQAKVARIKRTLVANSLNLAWVQPSFAARVEYLGNKYGAEGFEPGLMELIAYATHTHPPK